jgi:hypothetical protein
MIAEIGSVGYWREGKRQVIYFPKNVPFFPSKNVPFFPSNVCNNVPTGSGITLVNYVPDLPNYLSLTRKDEIQY